jgi:hypothetical protein
MKGLQDLMSSKYLLYLSNKMNIINDEMHLFDHLQQ